MVGWHHLLDVSKLWEMVKDREHGVLQSMESQRVGRNRVTEQQQQQRCIFFCPKC